MDSALLRLLMMRLRGGLRLRLAQLFSLRGAMFLLTIGGIAWLLLVGSRSSPDLDLFGGASFDPATVDDRIRTFMPLALAGMTVLTVFLTTGPSFHFSPTEINFLFVGPFRRRDLLLYKFCAYFAGAFLTSALVTILAREQTGSAVSAFAATFLTLLFIQAASAAAGLAVRVSERGQDGVGRRVAAVLVATLVAAVLITAWALPDHGLTEVLIDMRHSVIGTVVLAPFMVFAQLFLPQPSVAHGIGWIAAAVLIVAAVLHVVIRLDARVAELALIDNDRQNARWERMKTGGSYFSTQRSETRSIRRAPVLGGLGPMAWRQAIDAGRNSAMVFAVFVIAAACAGPLYAFAGVAASDTRAAAVVFFFLTFIVPRTLVCDFRSDLVRMELYKTLPIAPWRLCAGQLVVQVLLAYVIALVLIASLVLFVDGVPVRTGLILSVFAFPLTLLIYAVENTIFLLFPTKLIPMGRADFEFIGRAIVEFIVKTLVLSAAAVAAVGAGILIFSVFGISGLVPVSASWVTLLSLGLLMILVCQFAFRRFRVAEAV